MKSINFILVILFSIIVVACGNGGGGGGGDSGSRVTFTVDYGVSGGNNCATGQRIDSQETYFSIKPAGLVCTEKVLTFDGSSSGCTDGTCNTCTDNLAPCAETSVAQVISGLADGDYQLQVNGVINCTISGPTVCYGGSAAFSIENGTSLDLGIVPVLFMNLVPCNLAECPVP